MQGGERTMCFSWLVVVSGNRNFNFVIQESSKDLRSEGGCCCHGRVGRAVWAGPCGPGVQRRRTDAAATRPTTPPKIMESREMVAATRRLAAASLGKAAVALKSSCSNAPVRALDTQVLRRTCRYVAAATAAGKKVSRRRYHAAFVKCRKTTVATSPAAERAAICTRLRRPADE
jgi:hypothetical protein